MPATAHRSRRDSKHQQRVVSISRPWKGLTETTGVGDPRAGTKEKGEKYLAIVVERLAKFLKELSDERIDDGKFPF